MSTRSSSSSTTGGRIFDVDRDAARAVRNAVAAELVETGDLAAPAHFPGLRFGRLVTGLHGREWVTV